MNYPLQFRLKGGATIEEYSGPIPSIGDKLWLPGYPEQTVKSVAYLYGARGLYQVTVNLSRSRA